mgnify:CR=1 FL=1
MSGSYASMENGTLHKVLLVDGDCPLCNRFVKWLIRHDPKGIFLYASLDSDYAQKWRMKLEPRTLLPDSVILIDDKTFYTESTAVLKVLSSLAFPWNLGVIFFLVPKFFRDYIYRLLAKYRRTFFPEELCSLETSTKGNRLLP